MNLFNNVFDIDLNKRTVRLLGVSIYEVEFNEEYRKQNFLSGILKTKKSYNDCEKITYILGIPILKNVYKDTYETLELCIPPLYVKKYKTGDENRKIAKKSLEFIPQNYKNIYILNSNIGECFLFLNMAQKYLDKTKTNNCLFIATKNQHIQMINMLCPNISKVLIPELKYCQNEDFLKFPNQSFHFFYDHSYFLNVENSIRTKSIDTVYFTDFIFKKLGFIPSEFELQKISITQAERNKVINKVKRKGLNIDNFIYISDKSNSSEKCEKYFWEELTEKLRIEGYDIFQNEINSSKDLFTGAKNVKLTIKESIILSQFAKTVIMNRSGLSDVLALTIETPMNIIYSGFRERINFAKISSEKIMSAYTLKKLPSVKSKNIHEYNYDNYSNIDELIEFIIKNIKG